MKLKRSALCVSLLVLVLGASSPAQNFEVKTRTLKNGMKILIQEDHSIPNVALYTSDSWILELPYLDSLCSMQSAAMLMLGT